MTETAKAWRVSELAAAWGTYPKNIRRLIASGRLKAFSISATDNPSRKSGIRISDQEKRRWETENQIDTSGADAPSGDRPAIGLPTSVM